MFIWLSFHLSQVIKWWNTTVEKGKCFWERTNERTKTHINAEPTRNSTSIENKIVRIIELQIQGSDKTGLNQLKSKDNNYGLPYQDE